MLNRGLDKTLEKAVLGGNRRYWAGMLPVLDCRIWGGSLPVFERGATERSVFHVQ
jgi:hypothetical protein